MFKFKKALYQVVSALFLASCGAPSDQGASDQTQVAMDSISGDNIRAHVTFLADDLLEGRDTGSRGYMLGANYVAAQWKLLGLEPGGDDGSYFQTVPYVRGRIVTGSTEVTIHINDVDIPLHQGSEVRAFPNFTKPEYDMTAGVVFVGYGLSEVGLGIDDYGDVDVTGKIVLYLGGAPDGLTEDQFAFFSDGRNKVATAVAKGAVGAIQIQTPALEARRPWSRGGRRAAGWSFAWVDTDGNTSNSGGPLDALASITGDAAEKLFARSEMRYVDALEASLASEGHSFELAASLSIKASFEIEPSYSPSSAKAVSRSAISSRSYSSISGSTNPFRPSPF